MSFTQRRKDKARKGAKKLSAFVIVFVPLRETVLLAVEDERK